MKTFPFVAVAAGLALVLSPLAAWADARSHRVVVAGPDGDLVANRIEQELVAMGFTAVRVTDAKGCSEKAITAWLDRNGASAVACSDGATVGVWVLGRRGLRAPTAYAVTPRGERVGATALAALRAAEIMRAGLELSDDDEDVTAPSVAPAPASIESPQDAPDEDAPSPETRAETSPARPERPAGTPSAPPRRFSRWWVGLSASIDLTVIPSATDVCKLDSTGLPYRNSGYYCVDGSGADYPSRTNPSQNSNIVVGEIDQISGGITPGDVRILLSADYALNANFLVGARAGFVANTYPGKAASNDGKAFVPVDVEARATYVFGKEGIAKPGLQPMVLAGVGVAAFDARTTVQVLRLTGVSSPQTVTDSVQAWAISGPFYGAAGVGIRYALTPHAAFTFVPKFVLAFGSSLNLPIVQPEIGFQLGL